MINGHQMADELTSLELRRKLPGGRAVVSDSDRNELREMLALEAAARRALYEDFKDRPVKHSPIELLNTPLLENDYPALSARLQSDQGKRDGDGHG